MLVLDHLRLFLSCSMKIALPLVRWFMQPQRAIRSYYRALHHAYGTQHWWPARTRLEVILGAFLTQNTAWRNVERALANLRRVRKLNMKQLRELPVEDLALLIRSSGYFRQKALRLKTFIAFLDHNYGGSIKKMFFMGSSERTLELREELLALNGVGRETADSILLYAGNHPIFVVDAYTRRIFERHAIVAVGSSYDEIRRQVEHALIREPVLFSAGNKGFGHAPSLISAANRSKLAQHFNEFHGLIVQVGKIHCHKSKPKCEGCPLERFLHKRRFPIQLGQPGGIR